MLVQISMGAFTTLMILQQINVSCLKHAQHWTRIPVHSALVGALDVKSRMVRVLKELKSQNPDSN